LKKKFTVSWPDDFCLSYCFTTCGRFTGLLPVSRENPIGLSVEYQNVGEFDVTKFKAIVEVYNPNGT